MNKDILTVILVGLFGSGGIVAFIAVILQHREKMAQLALETMRAEASVANAVKKKLPLRYHPLFARLDELELFFDRQFELPDPGRTILVSEFVVHKIRVWREVLMAAANKMQVCVDECNEALTHCTKVNGTMVDTYVEGMKRYTGWFEMPGAINAEGTMAYDAESKETMRIFADKFQSWHSAREETVSVAIHEIANSKSYTECYERLNDIFAVYMYAFVEMRLDAERTIRDLNGELTGRKFLGVTIGE